MNRQLSIRLVVIAVLVCGCGRPSVKSVDTKLEDPLGIAIVQRLSSAFGGTVVPCPPYFELSRDEAHGYACMRLDRDVDSAEVEQALAPTLKDFDGWLQNPPGWVRNPGRLGAEFGQFRGSSVAGSHAVGIGVLAKDVVISNEMWSDRP